MATKAAVNEFISQRALAVVGASRSGKKFGNVVCRELKDKGYRIYPGHPQADAIGGDACYRAFGALPEPAGGVVVAVRPAEAERVVRDAAAAGIRRVWLQQGAESGAAVRFCEEQGMTVVAGQCILLHAEPVRSVHAIHRWFARIFGRLPR